jgi:hypothetical protein
MFAMLRTRKRLRISTSFSLLSSCFQVDKPYTKASFRPDIDELMMKNKKWPHWKDKAITEEYKSETILGKVWDFVGNKINEAVGADAKPKADDSIVSYIAESYIGKSLENKNAALEAISSMKRKMKQAFAVVRKKI